MKHVLMISLTVALCVAACGEKTNLELKARNTKDAQQKTGEQKPGENSEKPGDEVEGVLNMPKNTDNRKIPLNGSATRNIFIGTEGITTSAFCTENLAKTHKEKEKIKLQGKSQIIVRQVVTIGVPEVDSLKMSKNEPPKALLSLACIGNSADLSKEAEDQDVTVTKLITGASASVVGKLSVMESDYLSEAVVSCVTAEKMAKANEVLLPEGKIATTDILMAANSRMLFETSRSKNSDRSKYILVTCDEAPVAEKKEAAEAADVQE